VPRRRRNSAPRTATSATSSTRAAAAATGTGRIPLACSCRTPPPGGDPAWWEALPRRGAAVVGGTRVVGTVVAGSVVAGSRFVGTVVAGGTVVIGRGKTTGGRRTVLGGWRSVVGVVPGGPLGQTTNCPASLMQRGLVFAPSALPPTNTTDMTDNARSVAKGTLCGNIRQFARYRDANAFTQHKLNDPMPFGKAFWPVIP
jgi:hypothetical protein